MKPTILRALFVTGLLVCLRPAFAAELAAAAPTALATEISAASNPTQVLLSEFAWRLFAQVNQPAQLNGRTYRQWELWKSDIDTFSPNADPAAPKFRNRPHLQTSVLAQQIGLRLQHALGAKANSPLDFEASLEEVTRNDLSYHYIMKNGLNTQAGIAAFLGRPGAEILFPFGAIEVKAHWDKGTVAVPGAYWITDPTTGTVYSLTGIHLMMKITNGSYDPFTSPRPSWFWATFEFKGNRGLAAAQALITDGDSSPAGYAAQVLKQAGLASTNFVNYRCNGAQISFVDAQGRAMVLGNTQIEWFLAVPQPQSLQTSDPTKWKSWSSSCHACHAQASGQVSGNSINFFACTAPVGPLTGANLPGSQYRPFDFVWALFNAK